MILIKQRAGSVLTEPALFCIFLDKTATVPKCEIWKNGDSPHRLEEYGAYADTCETSVYASYKPGRDSPHFSTNYFLVLKRL